MTLPAFLVAVPPLLAGLPSRPATVSGRLWASPRGTPILVPGPGGRVHGALVELADPRLLGLIDAYAGVPGEAIRVELDARCGLRAVGAAAWVLPPDRRPTGRPVPSGRWRA